MPILRTQPDRDQLLGLEFLHHPDQDVSTYTPFSSTGDVRLTLDKAREGFNCQVPLTKRDFDTADIFSNVSIPAIDRWSLTALGNVGNRLYIDHRIPTNWQTGQWCWSFWWENDLASNTNKTFFIGKDDAFERFQFEILTATQVKLTFWGVVAGPTVNLKPNAANKQWIHVTVAVNRGAFELYINGEFYSRTTLGSFPNAGEIWSYPYGLTPPNDAHRNARYGDLRFYTGVNPFDVSRRIWENPKQLYENRFIYSPITVSVGPTLDLEADLSQSESLTADLTVELVPDADLAADLSQSESITADLTVDVPGDVSLAADLSQAESLTADLTIEAPGDVVLAADLTQAESLTANLTVDVPGEVALTANLSQSEVLSADLTIELPAPDLAADLSQSETLTALLTIEGAVAVSAVHYRGAVVLPYYRANSVLPHYRG